MKENHEKLLQAVVDNKPLDAANAFDSLIKDKISGMLDVYKTNIANEHLGLGGEKNDDETPEAEEADLTDDQIEELLGNLSDEELASLFKDMEDDVSDDETHEDEDDQGETSDLPDDEVEA
jgi:hypothetical protein